MLSLPVIGLSLLVSACAPADRPDAGLADEPAVTAVPDAPPVSIALSVSGAQGWQVEMNLPDAPEAERILIFSRSGGDYRRSRFERDGDGARLERIGGFDALVFPAGERQARFRIDPDPVSIGGTYDPFIDFSDGGQAVYLGAFELLPVKDRDAVLALDGEIDRWEGEQRPLPLTVTADAPIVIGGALVETGEASLSIQGGAPYVYVGPGRISRGDSFVGVVDDGLPEWIAARFDADMSRLFAFFEDAFGRTLPDKATLLFAFGGLDLPGISNTGGVLPGNQIVLDVSGSMLAEPDPRIVGFLQWFLSHESAHLFQNAGGAVGYTDRSDSWIGEGSANAMTDVVFARLGLVEETVRQSRMAQAYQACVSAIDGADMAALVRRNDQSHYDCGQVVWWIADAAVPDSDQFALWNALADRARDAASDMGAIATYDADMFFALLSERGAPAPVVAGLRDFIAGRAADPDAALRDLFAQVGLETAFADGALVSIAYSG